MMDIENIVVALVDSMRIVDSSPYDLYLFVTLGISGPAVVHFLKFVLYKYFKLSVDVENDTFWILRPLANITIAGNAALQPFQDEDSAS